MKNSIKINLVVVAIILTVVLPACKKEFNKISDDPNNPKEAPTSYLLTSAQKGLMDNSADHFWNGSVGSQLAQYWASNLYAQESRYQYTPDIINSHWLAFYAGGTNTVNTEIGGLMELKLVIDLCQASPVKYAAYGHPKNQIAVATVLQVWVYQNMTDVWGDIPYSEALQGTAIPSPKYDMQQDIYHDLLIKLDSALAWMNEGAGQGGPTGDVIYGGDMSKWMKFCNSLKLRVAIRIADREPILASQKINEAATGAFASNADNAVLNYSPSVPNVNPLAFNQVPVQNFCAANTMTDILLAMNDSRIMAYYDTIAGGIYVGRPYGQSDENAAGISATSVSSPSPMVRSSTFPGIFMDYAQVEFILAEAVERGFISGAASDHYDDAIRASFEFWGVTMPLGYLTQASVNYTILDATLTWQQIIGKQKWIALYMQGIQAWVEWRRLDFGILQLPVDGPLPPATAIPVRLTYPVSEQSVNGKNYSDAVSSQGADNLDTKVWWDMN